MNEPKPKPWRRKYGIVDAGELVRHIKEDKCAKCLTLARYDERESERAIMANRWLPAISCEDRAAISQAPLPVPPWFHHNNHPYPFPPARRQPTPVPHI